MKYILAHDLGTTGNKATLYSELGELISSSFAGYDSYYSGSSKVEQDPEDWWNSFCKATSDIINKSNVNPNNIIALGISGQMMSVVPVDNSGKLLRKAMIWADSRSVDQVVFLESIFTKEEIYGITGSRISPTHQGPKIAWIKKNEPEIYNKTHKFLQAKDYINLRLTGKMATDFSDAAMTALFDINKLQWSSQIIEALDLDATKLPEVFSSTTNLGYIRPDVSKNLGLSKKCQIILGAGDGCSASVGAGAVNVGDTYIYLGSSSWISTITEKPLIDREMRLFTGAHAVKGLYFPSGTMQAGGTSYSWIKNTLFSYLPTRQQKEDQEIYEYIDRLILECPNYREPIIYLPYLLGERSPIWNSNARGALIGLSASHEKIDLVKGVIEGVAMNLKWILDTMEESLSIGNSIRVIGGVAKSKSWRTILSNVLGKTITVPRNVDEATSMGAAVIAGVGSGLFDFSAVNNFINDVVIIKPVEDKKVYYSKLYVIFKKTYSSLIETYEELADIRKE
ncbi:MAG: FGGY-family carbohydrate kinase [Kosmotogaceae bacterium]